MTGILLVHGHRALTSAASALPRMSKKAIASTLLGTVGAIYSIAMKNDTYLKASLLWTAASMAIGYFTRKKSIIVQSRTLAPQLNTRWNNLPKKMDPKEFSSHARALYESRVAKPVTTHEQQKKFYYLMSVSHLFSPDEIAQVPNALRSMQLFRPYMEQAQYLSMKFDAQRKTTNPTPPLNTLKLRDFIRWQALVEVETMGKISGKRLQLTMKWIFEMIDKGILENPQVQKNYQRQRGDSEEQRFGEDDALRYFQYKFEKRHYPPSHPYSKARFQNVAPILGSGGNFRTTSFIRLQQ
ncbi:MAG TPA: hypothetical protein VLG44_06380 [Chlamydiales bacterium]|nr:hypothetical protein [Chlamydiales bacterium]